MGHGFNSYVTNYHGMYNSCGKFDHKSAIWDGLYHPIYGDFGDDLLGLPHYSNYNRGTVGLPILG